MYIKKLQRLRIKLKCLKYKIKSFLKDKHHRKHAALFGSGTSALIATLKILTKSTSGHIGVPVNVCPNVVTAIYAAGKVPVYIDIEEETCGIDPNILANLDPKPAAVIAVHSYGIPCKIELLQKICEKHGIYLIEDAAVAQGATIGTVPVGSFGILSICSFGSGKIVSAGGNGAALTDDPNLAEYLENESNSYGQGDKMIVDASSKLHTLCYNLFNSKNIEKLSFIFRTFAEKYSNSWLSAFDESLAMNLYDKLLLIDKNIERRSRMADIYSEIFSRVNLPFLCQKDGSVCWRFNIFLPQHRDHILKKMLADGDLVSSWYPPIYPYFEESSIDNWPVAKRQGDEIINLWVDSEVDENKCKKYAKKIISLYESLV